MEISFLDHTQFDNQCGYREWHIYCSRCFVISYTVSAVLESLEQTALYKTLYLRVSCQFGKDMYSVFFQHFDNECPRSPTYL